MAGVNIVEVPKSGRVNRYPRHSFQVATRPWQIQPFFIAPVLPGESMKNLLLQSRVVSDPIKHPLVGWWQEYYIFYVKHRDLDIREDLTAMMLDPDKTLTEHFTAAEPLTYHGGGTIDWARLCLERITDEYFRNEGETHATATLGGLPVASIDNQSWLDSAMNAADFTIDDVDVDANADSTITAGEIDAAMRQWQFMQAHKMTDMTYEDFLRTYGVKVAPVEQHRPELIRYLRDWTYPTNTVDPSTGSPSTALSWSIAERADKDRFFREPGFVFGVTVTRPKVYLGGQKSSAIGLMDNALSWLPAIMRDDPYTSLRNVAAGAGPLPGNTDSYWIDIKDLLLYGDQFTNFDITTADNGAQVALPDASLLYRYASETDADGLFSGAGKTIRQDGVVSLTIAGTVVDQTIGSSSLR